MAPGMSWEMVVQPGNDDVEDVELILCAFLPVEIGASACCPHMQSALQQRRTPENMDVRLFLELSGWSFR